MKIVEWISKLVQIPGRLTSIATEKVVCGADEVYDDALQMRQSEFNAGAKAVLDQEQIAIDGGTAEIAAFPEDITPGSGKIPTANAIAGYCNGFLKGSGITVSMSDDVTFSETVEDGAQKTFIYLNDTDTELTVTVPNTDYKTPDGEVITITILAGGYGEVSILNIGGTIFARGC